MDQHYITRAYLNGFCDPLTPAGHTPSLWLLDLHADTVKRRAPKNVAVKVDYYSVRRDDGTLDDSAERLLSSVESGAMPVLDRLGRGQFALNAEDREHLSIFLGFLITRTPGFRDYIERAAGMVGESAIRTMSRHPELFRRLVREAGIDRMFTAEAIEEARLRGLEAERHFVVRGSEDFSLGQALRLALTPASYIKDMRWEFAVTSGPEQFLTGDVPVTWRNDRARAPLGAGLGVLGTEVSFPITPSICLVADRLGAEGVRDVSIDIVRDLNRERVRHASRFIFGSREADAGAAQAMYRELREAGKAHAVPFRVAVMEEGQFREPLHGDLG